MNQPEAIMGASQRLLFIMGVMYCAMEKEEEEEEEEEDSVYLSFNLIGRYQKLSPCVAI